MLIIICLTSITYTLVEQRFLSSRNLEIFGLNSQGNQQKWALTFNSNSAYTFLVRKSTQLQSKSILHIVIF